MTGLLIAGIVGMMASFIVGTLFGKWLEHDRSMELARKATRLAMEDYEKLMLNKLKGIGV